MLSTNSWETGVDIPTGVCYTPPSSDWKEKIYAVFIYNPETSDPAELHGLTNSKDHAVQVAKEVGGYVETTQWLDPP